VIREYRQDPGAGRVQPVEVTHGFADRGPARDLLNAAMGRFFEEQGYVVGLGSYDLLLGLDAIRAAAPRVPLHLAGLEGVPGSEEYRLGGWGIGPVGDRGARLRMVFLAETAPEGAPAPDPLASFAKEAAAHPAEGYLVVGQVSPFTVEKLVREHPQILAAVCQWRSDVTSVPQRAGEAWIVYMGDRGRRLAELSVTRKESGWECLAMIAYLGPGTSSEPAEEAEVKEVLRRVEEKNRAELARASKPPVEGARYVGSDACKACHPAAYARWSVSLHSRAVADLAVDHQTDNPDCLKCHATGVGEPGGYDQESVDLAAVHCEACHGPGEGHPPKKLSAEPADKARCGKCHGLRDSPHFALPGYWEAIKH
jgi:hypothetical protein